MPKKPMFPLAVLIDGDGFHPASWLHPKAQAGQAAKVDRMIDMARVAEAAKIDLFFIADTPAARTDQLDTWRRWPKFMNVLEPMTLLSRLAGATTHIGLGATVSTSFFEPYNIARQFASLDQISNGRAAWNVVTSSNDYAARNFGLDRLPPHAERYEKARESVAIVKGYWDSWEDNAFIYDRETASTFDPSKQHPVDFKGKYFTVHGALNQERPPQGHPVIIQAGSSGDGKDLAAETADVVFSAAGEIESSRAFYADLKSRMPRFGRHPDQLKVLASLRCSIGRTRQEALDKYHLLQSLIHPDVGVKMLSEQLGKDLSGLPLDEPIPDEAIPETTNREKGFFERLRALILANRDKTLREIYQLYDYGTAPICGTPTDIADMLEEWIDTGAGDGFMLLFNALPSDLHDFVELVVPELQRRGRARTEYTGETLRDRLGLGRPANPHAAAARV
ncbi:LLM class flavin-dependent oxidoreductase [Mesorhizobium sp. INR15]|uniref:LLM class flavin-dependent oxidoreductase n=1 Tax=Mesorhizobium sp. INR15 TaxID=2654248 RepID=UPI0018964696|nr:LLM class flavin-dependent oxidoreductase [Mesorhizobium sp. INR15]QPC94496.1 NtaA/DmoA family FMN-dependent monooxygenase [Mesorhizobium sp. INR15]